MMACVGVEGLVRGGLQVGRKAWELQGMTHMQSLVLHGGWKGRGAK